VKVHISFDISVEDRKALWIRRGLVGHGGLAARKEVQDEIYTVVKEHFRELQAQCTSWSVKEGTET